MSGFVLNTTAYYLQGSQTAYISVSPAVTVSWSHNGPGALASCGATYCTYVAPAVINSIVLDTITATASGGGSASIAITLLPPTASFLPFTGTGYSISQPITITMSASDSSSPQAPWTNTNSYLIFNISNYDNYRMEYGCVAEYQPATHTIYLANDTLEQFASGAIGSNQVLEIGSKCSVNLAGASASLNGIMLTASVPVTFKPPTTWGGPWDFGPPYFRKRVYLLPYLNGSFNVYYFGWIDLLP